MGPNAMCSVRQNDVRDHIKLMKANNKRGILIQTSGKKYKDLEKKPNSERDILSSAFSDTLEYTYVINMDTETIHKEGCSLRGNDYILARLINLGATGLKLCECAK